MKMSFRWYGEGNDPIPLAYVRQIPGMEEVVWALHDKEAGEVWTEAEIKAEMAYIESQGLKATIVESLNIHEDIKLGLPTRDRYIKVYQESLKNLGKNGVKVVCYNFMPIFDWTRTEMFHPLEDGSTALFFGKGKIMAINPQELVEMVAEESQGLTLPGWEPERLKGIKALFQAYDGMTEERLRENFRYFIDAIIPTCEAFDIKMAIHPDDPPFSIFGLPRLVNNQANIDKLLAINPSPYNGLTFCTGSLGADLRNELVPMIKRYQERIHFMHVRNVRVASNGDFSEVSHRTADGTVDITGVMNALSQIDYQGYLRPDHGRHVFGEDKATCRPGYGLYDRGMGAMYLLGSWDMAQQLNQ
ncbi:mannonate dehydratase [Vagococcus sp. BWB3-3]|uniref:Mannonate dehydratase n=1 Tax=Vagococcus allomyrinae TaxID=2794353 RepID=A0A940SXL9_9ENTE|nr:mannonate dehydratase [Vagococcus allomyrinae]MBP1042508.1 mannonate dehydratase [Vagococcus allomyrinae]